ncbi:hypothetical protein SAMN05428953_11697 [Mesorhizobium muleiense]|uniref:Enoyl-(Acyl carrier protein) reductase n=1 Tax=Mesorhizobium muleiense TaxID=1004279 RepID=A0A1G9CLF2_9HYPH|nr:hypothetical protein SAMN05428953_11697 [Mesorhizobium muleiense]
MRLRGLWQVSRPDRPEQRTTKQPKGVAKKMTLECINPRDLPTPTTYTQVVVARGTKLIFVDLLPLAETWGQEADVPPLTNALARFGTPEEDIAPVVLFLASKDAQFLTGYTLTPDGGSIIDSGR